MIKSPESGPDHKSHSTTPNIFAKFALMKLKFVDIHFFLFLIRNLKNKATLPPNFAGNEFGVTSRKQLQVPKSQAFRNLCENNMRS